VICCLFFFICISLWPQLFFNRLLYTSSNPTVYLTFNWQPHVAIDADEPFFIPVCSILLCMYYKYIYIYIYIYDTSLYLLSQHCVLFWHFSLPLFTTCFGPPGHHQVSHKHQVFIFQEDFLLNGSVISVLYNELLQFCSC
jgi:hypothetical protein